MGNSSRASSSRIQTLAGRTLTRRRAVQAAGAGLATASLASLPAAIAAQDASPAAAEVTPYNGEEVTIAYGFWDAAQEAAIDTQIEAFKAVQPNITVEKQIVPWADYWTQLQTAVAGGETFDVFWINTASLPVYATAGALLPIDSIIGADAIDTANLPAPLVASYAWEGVQYGVPRDYDTIALFYNKDLFDAAGHDYPSGEWTWDDFRAAAEALTDAGNGIWGSGLQTSWQENYYNFIWQNGGRLLNDDLTACVVDEPEGDEAIQYLTGFFTDELTPSIAIQQSNPVADTLFPAGQVAMMTGGSFRAGTYAQADANIDVAPMPQRAQQATAIHGLANVIWSGSAAPGAALEFVKFLHGEEAETLLGESGATIPAFSGLQEIWVNANPDMNLQTFIDAAEYSVSVENPPSGFEWQIALQEVIIDGWSGNIDVAEIAAQGAAAATEKL